MRTSICPVLPERPRRLMLPEAPEETPYPLMAREVTKSPGTCSMTVGRIDDSCFSVNWSRSMMVTVIGRWRMSVTLRVPVTTTSFILAESLTSSACAGRTEAAVMMVRNKWLLFIRMPYFPSSTILYSIVPSPILAACSTVCVPCISLILFWSGMAVSPSLES